jgi:transcriptional repressor NrdR
MRCPYCRETNQDKVIDSRLSENGEVIRRRRACISCGKRFTTKERVEQDVRLMVVKRDGTRELFDIKKLERGIMRSLVKRPVSLSVIEDMIQHLQDEIYVQARQAHEISSVDLGEMVLEKLYTIDPVSYIRFASVYRKFENVEGFITEIENLTKKTK